jgi:hypothetical protein
LHWSPKNVLNQFQSWQQLDLWITSILHFRRKIHSVFVFCKWQKYCIQAVSLYYLLTLYYTGVHGRLHSILPYCTLTGSRSYFPVLIIVFRNWQKTMGGSALWEDIINKEHGDDWMVNYYSFWLWSSTPNEVKLDSFALFMTYQWWKNEAECKFWDDKIFWFVSDLGSRILCVPVRSLSIS